MLTANHPRADEKRAYRIPVKTEDRLAPGDAEWRARLEAVLRQKQENDQQIAKLLEDLRGGVKLPQELRGGAQGAVWGVRARALLRSNQRPIGANRTRKSAARTAFQIFAGAMASADRPHTS